MADFKVIEKTLQSGSNILEVTDAALDNNSIFEVYTDNVNVIPVGVSVSGTTASITFDSKPTSATGVKIFINNLEGEYVPTSGDRVEVTDASQYGNLICKISVNGEVTEIRSGTISANNVHYDNGYGGISQFEFNNSVTDRIDNLDANDVLYDENSTLYSAMGDIDTLNTTSKNLVGAINEVAQGSLSVEVLDNICSNTTATTKSFERSYKYGKIISLSARVVTVNNLSSGNTIIAHIDNYKPTRTTSLTLAVANENTGVVSLLNGSIRINESGYTDGDITVYNPSAINNKVNITINCIYFIE